MVVFTRSTTDAKDVIFRNDRAVENASVRGAKAHSVDGVGTTREDAE
jgi:hypothetical protein